MGYIAKEAWREGLIKSVLDNFWLAIYDGDLEVLINDGKKIKITGDNLKNFLEEYSAEDALPFYLARISKDTNYFSKSLDTLGTVHLFVKKRDDFPSLTMLSRKPKMMVRHKHYKALREPYAAIFLCDDDRGNMVLRDMEPPTHNEWNKDLGADKESSRMAIKEMEAFIKESLRSLGETVNTEPQDIPDLDRYLPDSDYRDYEFQNDKPAFEKTDKTLDEETGREVGADREAAEIEVNDILKRSVIVKSPASGNGDSSGGRNAGRSAGNLSEHLQGGGEGNGSGERIRTADIGFRSFVQKTKSGIEYHFIISGREDCQGAIRLIAVGDDGSYPAEIKSARDLEEMKNYEISGSLIKGLNIPKGRTVKLGVILASKKKYAIGIESYER